MGLLDIFRSKKEEEIKEKHRATIAEIAHLAWVIDIWAQKGGTGKSTFAAALGIELSNTIRCGIVDADVDSPYLPEFMGVRGEMAMGEKNRWIPLEYKGKGKPIKIVSASLFPSDGQEVQSISKIGPEYHRIIQDFFAVTDWGKTDLLISDSPAGSGDEHRAILKCSEGVMIGSFVVMIPNMASCLKRVIDISERMGPRILGVVENMADMYVPGPETIQEITEKNGLTYLGKIPRVPGFRGFKEGNLPEEFMGPVKEAARIVLKELKKEAVK